MKDLWKEYADDFILMTDDEIDAEERAAQDIIDENQSWLDAIASWKAAGKPRDKE